VLVYTLATTWSQERKTVTGRKDEENTLNQLYCLIGLFIDSNNEEIIVDTANGRVIKWDRGASNGTIVTGFELLTSVIVDRKGTLSITDGPSSEDYRIIRWQKEATSD